jgi:hypothetical protein
MPPRLRVAVPVLSYLQLYVAMWLLSTCCTLLLITVSSLANNGASLDTNIATFCDETGVRQNISNFGSIVNFTEEASSSNVTITIHRSFALAETLVFDSEAVKSSSIEIVGEDNDITINCLSLDMHTGFIFKGIRSISFVNLNIHSCGVLVNTDLISDVNNYLTALYFENCTNVILQEVKITHSHGSGMAVLNNKGMLNVINSTFSNNTLADRHSDDITGGSGVSLVLVGVTNSSANFSDCIFMHNNATLPYVYGGGIQVIVKNASYGNKINIVNSMFVGNGADFGGGMCLHYAGNPEDNSILVQNSTIEENFSYRDGGGVNLGFILKYANKLQTFGNNLMRFEDCNFINNRAALYGGGAALFSTTLALSDPDVHFMQFTNCNWTGNSAVAGSAVDISPSFSEIYVHGVFPRPLFQNCSFVSNKLRKRFLNDSENVNVSVSGEGTVLITGFRVQFEGENTFANNMGCGIYLSSGSIELLENSETTFVGNRGNNGGALALGSFAVILINTNSYLSLINNTASLSGGGIYVHSHDPHDQLGSMNCFIHSQGGTSGVSFLFEGNRALNNNGNDVYSTSVRQCGCSNHSGKLETFRCRGNVSAPNDFDMATKVNRFEVNHSINRSVLTSIVPGGGFYEIPIIAYDVYNNSRETIYEVINETDNSDLEASTNHVSQNQLQFVGALNASSLLRLEFDSTILSFNITSSSTCPPGFHLSNDTRECECAAELLFGLSHCENKKAYIIHGFWMGRCLDEESVCTSHCPLGFCVYQRESSTTQVAGGIHELPQDHSQLEHFMCGPTRKGVVCGSCVENNSAYYHSYEYSCGDEKLCHIGIPLYILSELLPLTVMFFAIIIFDLNFTAGCVNGFIFYAQFLDSIAVDANGSITFPPVINELTSIHRFIYRNLNFDFFSIEKLSFCLWHGATTLDVLVMKYVTILYAMGLLVLLIIFMNTWKCKRLFSCWRPRTIQSSAKNGLTAFIVICYSQCARVSFQILSPGVLYGLRYTYRGRVAFRSGNYSSFRSEHLAYAIPAIFVLFVMSLIPFFLVLYPLIFKTLGLCRLSESRVASIISRLLPVPLLDSFQSSFKDNFRFFAGLYFLYRLLALAAYAYSSTLVLFYTWVELKLIIILALHSVVQPYKVRWHNIIDSLIFANLAIINGITLFNYFEVVNSKADNWIVFSVIQTILIFIPFFCTVAYFSIWVLRKCKPHLPSVDISRVDSSVAAEDVQLPPLRGEEEFTKREALLSDYTYGM